MPTLQKDWTCSKESLCSEKLSKKLRLGSLCRQGVKTVLLVGHREEREFYHQKILHLTCLHPMLSDLWVENDRLEGIHRWAFTWWWICLSLWAGKGKQNGVRCPYLINKETPSQIASFSSPVSGWANPAGRFLIQLSTGTLLHITVQGPGKQRRDEKRGHGKLYPSAVSMQQQPCQAVAMWG